MKESDVLDALIEIHRRLEKEAGFDPDAVSPDICPLEDLDGFDSPLVPNVIRALGKHFGLEFEKGQRLKSCYSERGKPLKLRDVAKKFCQLYGGAGGAS